MAWFAQYARCQHKVCPFLSISPSSLSNQIPPAALLVAHGNQFTQLAVSVRTWAYRPKNKPSSAVFLRIVPLAPLCTLSITLPKVCLGSLTASHPRSLPIPQQLSFLSCYPYAYTTGPYLTSTCFSKHIAAQGNFTQLPSHAALTLLHVILLHKAAMFYAISCISLLRNVPPPASSLLELRFRRFSLASYSTCH